MKKLWKFTGNEGRFISAQADRHAALYFPLCNKNIMSSITARLHGDIKQSQSSFLTEPATRASLQDTKTGRNFWLYLNNKTIWSAAGVSKNLALQSKDVFSLEAGLLYQQATRANKTVGLQSRITSIVPASDEPVEIMQVAITNISRKSLTFSPVAAIPVYARSADNIRDHRHVSSLLNRVEVNAWGMVATPTMVFDEAGHRKNKTSYFVYGLDDSSKGPQHVYATRQEFLGDDSDFEFPAAVRDNRLPLGKRAGGMHGRELVGALRFGKKTLKPGGTITYTIIMGIVSDKGLIPEIMSRFDMPAKIEETIKQTQAWWRQTGEYTAADTADAQFNNWFKWVSIQPTLRKLFGCSFLPDFDYGKGGRGWRDLWQDALALTINNPADARSLLINNFAGVRVDGSNATIIGKEPGEFIADRNNISRVWMDHGAWPVLSTLFYVHQTGDLNIVLQETSYFRDHQLSRSREIDTLWAPAYGKKLKTKTNDIYTGSLLEHMLVQCLAQFFNVGAHNHIKLENADWNDALDMAAENGESVAFTCAYAQVLEMIAELVSHLPDKKISVFLELAHLLDTLKSPVNYDDIAAKRQRLKEYFDAANLAVTGRRQEIDAQDLIKDLRKKADWIRAHIRKSEWLPEGFYNGYYNNDKQRVEGTFKNTVRMTLTAQTFAIMSGVATAEQIPVIIKNVNRYLKDPLTGGIRLNTDFKEEQHNFGRAFSFAYGEKENGAVFSHMAVMYANALLSRGFAREGYEVLNRLYTMAADSERSKIYPCLPEYFSPDGRGLYCYLTGWASWYVLTAVTQMFGVRGEYGDLLLEPKLTAEHFKRSDKISLTTVFGGKRIAVTYTCLSRKSPQLIAKLAVNGHAIALAQPSKSVKFRRDEFLALAAKPLNTIEITLQ